ncbi:MAG: branched-chain amino acid ABC transporter permease [Oligoflexales bacterium]
MNYLLELTITGISRGSIYALLALGYTMVYGIIGMINFAHGEIYMLSAFVALVSASILQILGFGKLFIFIGTLLIAITYGCAYGLTVERMAYKPLRNSPRLTCLISAIGMSIFLQNYVLLGYGSEIQPFPALIPEFAFLEPVSTYLLNTDFVIIVATLLATGLLLLFTRYSKMGMAMRAVSQDQTMAMLLGIDINRIIAATFVIGSGLAAIAAVLIGSHMRQINYFIGFTVGIKAFTAAVLGGIGNITGAVVGGYILGIVESYAAGYISSSYKDVFAFSLLVLILIFRPAGLLGVQTTEKV